MQFIVGWPWPGARLQRREPGSFCRSPLTPQPIEMAGAETGPRVSHAGSPHGLGPARVGPGGSHSVVGSTRVVHALIVPGKLGHPRERDQAELVWASTSSCPRRVPIRRLPLVCFRSSHLPQPLRNPLRKTSAQAAERASWAASSIYFVGNDGAGKSAVRPPPGAHASGLSLRLTPNQRFWRQAAGRPIPDVFRTSWRSRVP